MNRKEFLSLLLASLFTPSLKAQYSESEEVQKTQKQMAYILLNLYESPPRWLLDLPLIESPRPHPMICTKIINSNPVYKTIRKGNINFPSLWENKISGQGKNKVSMSELLDQMLIIRGCNMNKDGHDLNSRVLEASAPQKTSIGGRIADNYPAHFPALAVGGTMADPFKSVVSSFNTEKGLKAFICREEAQENYIEQALNLYYKSSNSGPSVRELLKRISNHLKDSDPLSYGKIRELQKLPFEKIFLFFKKSHAKYQKLLESSYSTDKIVDLTDTKIPAINFPARFKLNQEKSKEPLDYMGAFQFESYILTNPDLNQMFKNRRADNIAKNFALAETALKFSLTNVLILNFDPLTNINLKDAAPIKDISTKVEGDEVIFTCPRKKRFNTPKEGMKMTFDAHFIGTYPALIGYSLFYQHFCVGLLEFKRFLKSNKNAEQSLFQNSLIHLTSEFERAPQKNQAGSDHGWRGHTSTFFSGRFSPGVKLMGTIAKDSTNALGNVFCTWGAAADYPPIKRQMRYGDIVASIAAFFKVNPTQGGVSLFKYDGEKVIPRFKPQGEA